MGIDKDNNPFFIQKCEDCGWHTEMYFQLSQDEDRKDDWNLIYVLIKNM